MVQTRPVTGTYGLVVYRPVWMPFNDVAKEITFSYINQFGFPSEGRNGEKYRMAVASFLYAAQRVILKEYPEADDGKPFRDIFLGVRRRDEAWSHYLRARGRLPEEYGAIRYSITASWMVSGLVFKQPM